MRSLTVVRDELLIEPGLITSLEIVRKDGNANDLSSSSSGSRV